MNPISHLCNISMAIATLPFIHIKNISTRLLINTRRIATAASMANNTADFFFSIFILYFIFARALAINKNKAWHRIPLL